MRRVYYFYVVDQFSNDSIIYIYYFLIVSAVKRLRVEVKLLVHVDVIFVFKTFIIKVIFNKFH